MEQTEGVQRDAAVRPLVERYFTDWRGPSPYESVEWEVRDAWPADSKYHEPGLRVPRSWSENALNITSKLYLSKGEETRETGVDELVHRVAFKIAQEGHNRGYLGDGGATVEGWPEEYEVGGTGLRGDARAFYDELSHVMLNQLAVFNSPVLFNVGRPDRPQQVSACFILSVEDTTASIMETGRREAFIFKGGSGSGFDVSRLRASMEPLSTGGTASGPVSFMRLWDAGAGTFKSGGTTRRAAKLVKCDVDHPDIRDFILCKRREEQRLWRAVESGENVGFDEEGERNVAEMTSYQNANNSVGVTDAFMSRAIHGGQQWHLHARKTGESVEMVDASELLDLIAGAAHYCACPGMMYMDAINRMHTTPVLDGVASPVRSSNPCGEYLSNDDTSCNLGSINVLKFVRDDGSFDVEGFRHTVDVMALAMDILVDFADFPDDVISRLTRKLRQLGLGYSNMGAAIMAQGLAYDSNAGRDFAASVTALLTGRVYRKSALVAEKLGPFHYWEENREAMLGVLTKHADALPADGTGSEVWNAADMDWLEALSLGRLHGYRNAQATVIPPAGTTSYFLDCDTTGIEPAFELVVHKQLAGGESMTIANQSVGRALKAMGYVVGDLEELMPTFDDGERAVFATANEISYLGHLKMMAAVQPFVSGGISKTINMPQDATVGDVRDAYVQAWRLGLKDVAVYRNGSKARQPHAAEPKGEIEVEEVPGVVTEHLEHALDAAYATWTTMTGAPASTVDLVGGEPQGGTTGAEQSAPAAAQVSPPPRRRLPRTRRSLTHKIHLRGQVGEYEGYIHAGMYPDGALGEFFLEGFGKAGSFTTTTLGAMATACSIAIQYGVPFEVVARKYLNVSDETGGMVVPDAEADGPPAIRSAKSIVDYVARWLVLEFGDVDLHEEFGVRSREARERAADRAVEESAAVELSLFDPASVAQYASAVASAEADARPARRTSQIVRTRASNGHANAAELGPTCPQCGSSMRPTGGCFTCSCGHTSGCG